MAFLKVLKYYWWFLFYSAYWTAYNLGEKDEPEGNAIYYFNLLIGFHFFGIVQLILFWGYDFTAEIGVGVCVLAALIIPYLAFRKGNRYKTKSEEFKFLKDASTAKMRHILLITQALWSIIFVAFGGLIRM